MPDPAGAEALIRRLREHAEYLDAMTGPYDFSAERADRIADSLLEAADMLAALSGGARPQPTDVGVRYRLNRSTDDGTMQRTPVGEEDDRNDFVRVSDIEAAGARPPEPADTKAVECEALRDQRDLLLRAAQTVLDAAESEMWLYYKGTDESRLRSLQDAVDKVEC